MTDAAVLRSYDPSEAIGTKEAAKRAGRSERTIREWAALHQIGRRIAGQWAISAPALDMLLENDGKALDDYLAGDRTSEHVRAYFNRRGIPLIAIVPPATDVSAASADFAAARKSLM